MIQRNPSACDYSSCPLIPHLVSRKCLQRSNTSLRTHSRFLFSEKLLPRNEGKGKYYLHIVLTEQTDNLTHRCDAIASCFISSLSSSSSQQDSNVSCLRSKYSSLLVHVHLFLTLRFFLVKTSALLLLVFWRTTPPPPSTMSIRAHTPSCQDPLLHTAFSPKACIMQLFTAFVPAVTVSSASVAAEGSTAWAQERCCRCLVRMQQETSGIHSTTIC